MNSRKLSAFFLALLATVLLAGAARAQEEMAEEEASLYDRLGGLPAISAVVNDFIDILVPDEFINQNEAVAAARDRVPPAYLKYQVTAMVCQATGGPCTYTGLGMDEAHAHLAITGAEWDRMVEIFLDVLAKYQVPEAETNELVAIVATTKDAIVIGDSE